MILHINQLTLVTERKNNIPPFQPLLSAVDKEIQLQFDLYLTYVHQYIILSMCCKSGPSAATFLAIHFNQRVHSASTCFTIVT